ncbi:MAG TPA: hypothetical protein VMN35_00490 [Gaiellaceae bacterium]|nr:hypothetical protein [Gaiellaceae bacterium]
MSVDRTRESRWTPLLGVLFVVLLVLGLFVVGGQGPEAGAPGNEVVAYYEESASRELASSILAIVAAATLVFFAAHVRRLVAVAEPGHGYLSATLFGGAVILATAIGIGEGLHGALAIDPEYLTPSSAETLNTLDKQFFFPTMLGFGVFMLSFGLAIVRLRFLPAWLGWIAIFLSVVAFTPAAYFAFLLIFVWIVVASILLYARSSSSA